MQSLSSLFAELIARPGDYLVARWNWKAALLSSLVRGLLFFAVNARSGWRAATGALLAEFCLRAVTAGFYGALTQAFRKVEPVWHGTVAALICLPLCAHSLELAVHWVRGTPNLVASILASAAFTVLSTSFNLHAMRRGAFITGHEAAPLGKDLLAVPGLVVGFFGSVIALVRREGIQGLPERRVKEAARGSGGRRPLVLCQDTAASGGDRSAAGPPR